MDTWGSIAATIAAVVKGTGSLRAIEDSKRALEQLNQKKGSPVFNTILAERLEWDIENTIRIHCDTKTQIMLGICRILVFLGTVFLVVRTGYALSSWNMPLDLALSILPLSGVFITLLSMRFLTKKKKLSDKEKSVLESLLQPIFSQNLSLQKSINTLLVNAEDEEVREDVLAGIISLARKDYIRGMNYTKFSGDSEYVITRYGYLSDDALYYFQNEDDKRMNRLLTEWRKPPETTV